MRLRKRGRVWYADLRPLDAQGHRRRLRVSTGCTNRSAAEARALELERTASDPAGARRRGATLSEALELLVRQRHEDALAGRRSEATVRFYAAKAGQLLRVFEHGGDADAPRTPYLLSSLDAAEVDRFISTRRSDGAADGTIHKEIVTLRCALKLARRRGLYERDPAEVMPVAFDAAYVPRERVPTLGELERVMAQLPRRHAAQVAWMAALGGEASAATSALREDCGDGAVLVRGTKRASRKRLVPVVTETQKALLAVVLECADGDAPSLFRRWGALHRDLARACRAAKVAPMVPSDFRRFLAHHLLACGVPDGLVSRVLGHTSARMVRRVYGRMEGAALVEAVAAAVSHGSGTGPKTVTVR